MSIYDVNGHMIINSDQPVCTEFPAMKRYNDTTFTTTDVVNGEKLFMVAHISDLHNDPVRYGRFLRFVSENSKYINIAVETGDLVDAPIKTLFDEMADEEIYDIDLLKCVGNHENSFDNNTISLLDLYSYLRMNTNTGELYYYKDYDSYGVRVIVLNPYDANALAIRENNYYSDDQIDWLISTLKDAKTKDYNVIICRHDIETKKTQPNDSGFYQRFEPRGNSYTINLTIIEDIVNAFRNGESINKTYTYTTPSRTQTVNTTFSGKGKFVCYMCGHVHREFLGYSRLYSDQLYLCLPACCLKSTYRQDVIWNAYTDTPRVENEKEEDLFNLYAFDFVTKLVKVYRVGADMSADLTPRRMAVFEYDKSE